MKLPYDKATPEAKLSLSGEVRQFFIQKKEELRIVPTFLPFAGCPGKCVFCAQDKQSGQTEQDDKHIREAVLNRLKALQVQAEHNAVLPVQLAFYGGTFTALPLARQAYWLDFYQACRHAGLAASCRCSTRPDAVDGPEGASALLLLKKAGLGVIELGVQSFNSHALVLSQRGYSGLAATHACHTVQNSGFDLGIQLLPGMPGVTPEIFLEDVEQALALKPKCMRFYPCLVPEGTGLAEMWRLGTYAPWGVEETVQILGKALAMAWAAEVPVIRLSVAPEGAFDAGLLAGPRHPALGSMVQAKALLHIVARHLRGQQYTGAELTLPAFCQGFAWGHAGNLRNEWADLRVRLHFDSARTDAALAY